HQWLILDGLLWSLPPPSPPLSPTAADNTSLSLAGLIYGSLPVTPATFFFACEYGLCQSYIGMATVLGTFLFGPLVYVLTQLAFLVMNHYEQLLEQVEASSRSMALVGGICALWTLLALLRLLLSCRPAPPTFPHATTTAAAQTAADSGAPAGAGTAIDGSGTEGTGGAAAAAGVAEGGRGGSEQDPYELHRVVGQMLVCCIALCWTSASVASLLCRTPLPPLPSLLRYLFHTTGHLASAVFTALLALSELLCSALGPSLVHRLRFYLVFSGWVLAVLPVVLPLVLSPGWPDIPALCPTDLISCWYPFGSLQFLAALIIYSIAVMIIIASLSLLIWEQYAGLRASGLPINWSDLPLSWQPPPNKYLAAAPPLLPPPWPLPPPTSPTPLTAFPSSSSSAAPLLSPTAAAAAAAPAVATTALASPSHVRRRFAPAASLASSPPVTIATALLSPSRQMGASLTRTGGASASPIAGSPLQNWHQQQHQQLLLQQQEQQQQQQQQQSSYNPPPVISESASPNSPKQALSPRLLHQQHQQLQQQQQQMVSVPFQPPPPSDHEDLARLFAAAAGFGTFSSKSINTAAAAAAAVAAAGSVGREPPSFGAASATAAAAAAAAAAGAAGATGPPPGAGAAVGVPPGLLSSSVLAGIGSSSSAGGGGGSGSRPGSRIASRHNSFSLAAAAAAAAAAGGNSVGPHQPTPGAGAAGAAAAAAGAGTGVGSFGVPLSLPLSRQSSLGRKERGREREREREWERSETRSMGSGMSVAGHADGEMIPTLLMSPSRVVATRWRQKTDLDSQNALLLFCCYAVFSMLVSCTISIFALLNGGRLEGHLALLLLLMHVLLSYSQGAVLFLAFGMHAGLVLPLVAAREWWRKQRLSFLGEVSPFFVDEWQYLAPDDDYPMPGAPHSNSMMLARGWSMNPAQLQLFPRDWDIYSRGWEDALSVRDDGMSVRDYYPSYPIDEGDEDTVVSTDAGGDDQTDRDDAETVVEVTEDSVF
ncbi:unnamed protein product, partial [Closterium sp. NIES-54]